MFLSRTIFSCGLIHRWCGRNRLKTNHSAHVIYSGRYEGGMPDSLIVYLTEVSAGQNLWPGPSLGNISGPTVLCIDQSMELSEELK